MNTNPESAVSNSETCSTSTRLLAAVCAVCPFCILARMFPKSGYARFMQKVESNCPACKAYAKMKGWPSAVGPG
ncbi:MAG: hypothetical protein JXB04_04625 [Kiritimatiellae bacterium]|nr:hypothetical protein [Kiritimatiellia bacterium]